MSEERGEVLLEVFRKPYSKRLIFAVLIFLAIATVYCAFIQSNAFFVMIFLLALLFYSASYDLFYDHSQSEVTVFSNGVQSRWLKHSGSDYLSWNDIRKTELVHGWFHLMGCYYLSFKPFNEAQYNYTLPFFKFPFWHYSYVYGLNAMSLRISFILDVSPSHFHRVCEDAREAYHEKHGIKG